MRCERRRDNEIHFLSGGLISNCRASQLWRGWFSNALGIAALIHHHGGLFGRSAVRDLEEHEQTLKRGRAWRTLKETHHLAAAGERRRTRQVDP
jgi:hypothetical protein